jgi:hypothetical protein
LAYLLPIDPDKEKIESQICQKEETHESNVNLLQKSCVSLESLFTRDDQTKNKNVTEESSLRKFQETQKINIGTFEATKYLNLGTNCTDEEVRKVHPPFSRV